MATGLKFDHTHYIPILKTKRGELDALRSLTREQTRVMTPLFEIHPGTNKNPQPGGRPKQLPKPISLQAAAVCKALARLPITRKPFFLDTAWFDGKGLTGDPAIIATTFKEARRAGLNPIPVVRASYSQATLRQLRQEIQAGSGECLFRIRSWDLYKPVPPIAGMLAAVGVAASAVHFLLDYGSAPMQLPNDLPLIPTIAAWRTLSASAGAFPESLANFSKMTWHNLPRSDWATWKSGHVAGRKSRYPAYGDYACRFPGKPPSGGKAGVNLRYACADEWLVQTGGFVSEGKSADMVTIHGELVANAAFCTASHCAGDAEYAQRIPPSRDHGGSTQWVQWSVTHHLVYVLDQLANHSWP